MLEVLEDQDKLINFLRMEKWIFDSPGQAGECLRQFVKDLYQGNKLAKGQLKLGDKTVDLGKITMPILNIYASADHLVPPAATKPLNDLVSSKDKTLYEFKGGHIGVFVGSRSQKELAPAISKWLIDRDGTTSTKVAPPKATAAPAKESPKKAEPATEKPATAKAAPAKAAATKAKAADAAKPKTAKNIVPEVFSAALKKSTKK
jgi:poly(3-hydroxyalkanoate) synthetase